MKWIAALLIALSLSAPVRAADVIATAQNAAKMVEDARAQLESARSSKSQVKAFASGIRAYEVALVAMQGGLRELRQASRKANARYTDQRTRVEKALIALQAIEKGSVARRVWHPDGMLASVRAGMILSDLLPALNAEASNLRAELSGLSTLTALQEAAEADMRAARTDLQMARDDLKRAIVVKAAVNPPPEDRVRRLDLLSRSVVNLEEMASGLGAIPAADLIAEREPPIEGTLKWPVTGDILHNYEEPDAAGVARPGLIMSASPDALVVSPEPAEIVYAGQFLDQGKVVVLELSEDFLLVLAGLGQTFVRTGDIVEDGTPVGLLSGEDTSDEEFLIDLSKGSGAFFSESLYIELRINGIAENPAKWFRLRG